MLLYLFLSAGIRIRKFREKNRHFTFSKYLENVKDITNLQDEAAQSAHGGVHMGALFFPVAVAARELAIADDWLKKVGQSA